MLTFLSYVSLSNFILAVPMCMCWNNTRARVPHFLLTYNPYGVDMPANVNINNYYYDHHTERYCFALALAEDSTVKNCNN